MPAWVLAEKLFRLMLNPFSLWRPGHLLGVLAIYIGKQKFQLENHMVHATACYDFCDLRQCMFSTVFNLSQLILMGCSSTITICYLNGYAQKHITLFRYWGFWRTNQNILPNMELLICDTVALVLVLCGELDHIQDSYMTCIVHTARIINEIDILAVRRRHVIHQPCI